MKNQINILRQLYLFLPFFFWWFSYQANGMFLSTDLLKVNSNPFTPMNNNPMNTIDENGMQPIYLNLVKDAGTPSMQRVIKLSYKDVNLDKVYDLMKHRNEPFLDPDALLPYADIPFDGRLFYEAHGMGFTSFGAKGLLSQHYMLGDLTQEIENFTGTKVESIHLLGCEASNGIRSMRNRILGKVFASRKYPGKLVRFSDVPADVELFASPYMTLMNMPENVDIQVSSSKTFLRPNEAPLELHYETLMHPNFRNTPEHAQIFDRYRYGNQYPAERNFVGTWMKKFDHKNYTDLPNWVKQVTESSVFMPYSAVANIPR